MSSNSRNKGESTTCRKQLSACRTRCRRSSRNLSELRNSSAITQTSLTSSRNFPKNFTAISWFLLEKQHFFPGCLIHTNEFMVLLGEGYYAERTSKQTVEVLKRRGKVLDSQVDSLKAMMKDLQAEASYFDTTASEAAEGLVEIREEYGEENLSERASESGLLKQDSSQLSEADNLKDEDADEEYARIMSRLDELEKEELAWEIENGSAESKQNNVAKSDNAKYGDEDNVLGEAELAAETENRSDSNKQNNVAGNDNENNEDEQANTVSGQFSNQISLDHNLRLSEVLFMIIAFC
ncbi:hypothetical protein AB3S75_006823 [Citrus x aurantiifolia]